MNLKNILFVIGGLLIVSIIISFSQITLVESLRIVFGAFYILFLPGFAIVYFCFEDKDIIEKIALSFALSIAVVPLVVFYLNYLLNIKITAFNVFLTVFAIIGVTYVIAKYNKKKHEDKLLQERFTAKYKQYNIQVLKKIHERPSKEKLIKNKL